MKQALIIIMVLAGTIGCASFDDSSKYCTEDYHFVSAESLEALKKNNTDYGDGNRFAYGDHIAGDYNNGLKLNFRGGERGLSMFLAVTNTGKEDIPLVLSMELLSDDSTYYPNAVRTWTRYDGRDPVFTDGGTARVLMEGARPQLIAYYFDYSLLENSTLDMLVKVGEDEATEPLIETEMIQVVRRTNCFLGDHVGFEEVRNMKRQGGHDVEHKTIVIL